MKSCSVQLHKQTHNGQTLGQVVWGSRQNIIRMLCVLLCLHCTWRKLLQIHEQSVGRTEFQQGPPAHFYLSRRPPWWVNLATEFIRKLWERGSWRVCQWLRDDRGREADYNVWNRVIKGCRADGAMRLDVELGGGSKCHGPRWNSLSRWLRAWIMLYSAN